MLRALGIEVVGPVRQGHERRRVYTLKYMEATGRTGRTGRAPGVPDACMSTGADGADLVPQDADGGVPIPTGCGRSAEESLHRRPSEADGAAGADDLPAYRRGHTQGAEGSQQ